jgi:hypothetical protein
MSCSSIFARCPVRSCSSVVPSFSICGNSLFARETAAHVGDARVQRLVDLRALDADALPPRFLQQDLAFDDERRGPSCVAP